MPEFFLELFSEEIPARMQALAARQLDILVSGFLQKFSNPDDNKKVFYGPRRIAVSYDVWTETVILHGLKLSESPRQRGPRIDAPPQALEGFLKRNNLTSDPLIGDRLIQENGYYYLLEETHSEPERLAELAATKLPLILSKLPWPKSMRWGQSGNFTWVRPLRRIICLLDGEIIPLTLGPVTASNETEGHRVHAPGPFTVSSAAMWEEKLREHHVIADQDERRRMIAQGLADLAASRGLTIVDDNALLEEVTGLVEWPVPMIGRIDESFMSLPPEVRELSMKVNQKYFALRDAAGNPAPYFAFIANLEAPDNGAHIISGNETVLRARLSDARHFWDQDLKTPLDELLPKLEKITFHAKIGTQRERADRIAEKAHGIAIELQRGVDPAERMLIANSAKWAGLLCKADLVTGMVGEFPELQGIMGGYYAEKNPSGWDGPEVGAAIKTHYQPKGPSDDVPSGTIAISVALADKIDTLVEFFRINEKPTGSGDPYALRRAALGVIQIIRINNLRLSLRLLIHNDESLFDFIIERLRVLLRSEGKRYDVLNAVFAVSQDDDISRLLARANALSAMLGIENGGNLLVAYRRAANILKVEEASSDKVSGQPDATLFKQDQERNLFQSLHRVAPVIEYAIVTENFHGAMMKLAELRPDVDAFFSHVTVNDELPEIRRNRFKLLALLRDTMHQIADFSKIEG